MRLLGFGSRTWTDAVLIGAVLDVLCPSVVIEGEAEGADRLFRIEAEKRGIEVVRRPALWKKHGKAAGPIRNQEMLDLDRPDRAVACISGRMGSMFSPGSADMASRILLTQISLIVFRDRGHVLYPVGSPRRAVSA